MTTEQQAHDEHNRVVVGVDGSESSKHALRWAQFIARASGSTLEVVSAWQPYTAYGWMAAGWAAMPTDWNPAQDTEKALTEMIDEVFGAQRPDGLQLTVREGNAAHLLLQASEGPNAGDTPAPS
jgi:nucleotide-binding universal stress UspA family protein